jgi:hypothetical protein
MTTSHDQQRPVPPSLDELRTSAGAVAEALEALPNAAEGAKPTGGGSRHRSIPEDLRKRFIDVRAALFQRGIYDPVLVRFDTASAPQATTGEIAAQLATIAASL